MIMIISPKYSVAGVIGQIKVQTIQQTQEKVFLAFKSILEREYPLVTSYFVSTVGIDEKSIIKYVQFQERQDLGQMMLEWF